MDVVDAAEVAAIAADRFRRGMGDFALLGEMGNFS